MVGDSTTCRVLSVELPGTVVFDYPTISALAEFAATLTQHIPGQHASSAGSLVPAPPVERALAVLPRSALKPFLLFSGSGFHVHLLQWHATCQLGGQSRTQANCRELCLLGQVSFGG